MDGTTFSAHLISSDGSRTALSGEIVAGRSADCGLTIDDAKVSRHHAIIKVEGTKVTVEDLGSSNGTVVNLLRIHKPTQLYNGDALLFEKHSFKVELLGGEEDLDATVVEIDDATIVSIPEVATAPEAIHPPAAAPETPQQKPEPEPEPKESLSGDFDLPGSWVDSGTGDETRVLSMDDAALTGGANKEAGRASDFPHLLVISGEESLGAVFELQPAGLEEADVWEIGREKRCEIVFPEESVSARHAQIIHQGGRWRLVNLVSANGIFVNGKKCLTAYLAEADEIALGMVKLVFYPAIGAQSPSDNATASSELSKPFPMKLVLALAVAVLAAAAAYFVLR
jgi:pSer/pThr/pTyr-binding forkhead associated (FHA) protein